MALLLFYPGLPYSVLHYCIGWLQPAPLLLFYLVSHIQYCIVLYCIVLYCIVLYCIVLYCIVLYCIVLYCIVLYCIIVLFPLIPHCVLTICLHCNDEVTVRIVYTYGIRMSSDVCENSICILRIADGSTTSLLLLQFLLESFWG